MLWSKGASLLLFIGAVTARPSRYTKRQDGPVDPGTSSDCTWYDTALDESYTCGYFEAEWYISHQNFVSWNPGVKEDCSGIKVGNSYCVEVNNGSPPSSTSVPTSTTMPPTSTMSPTGSPKPSPTQEGLINTCQRFYKAETGDTCDIIQRKFNIFSLEQFISWNPAVMSDCKSLWAGYYYCIGIPGTPTSAPPVTSATVTSTPTTPTPTGPIPTQPGIISTCNRYHQAISGDTCSAIATKYGTFTLDQFIKWNPSVKADCFGLWAGYYYCIGIPGTPTQKPTTMSPTPTGCTNPNPSPTQPGAKCQCKKWHKVASGDNCDAIQKKYMISAKDFNTWNPQVGTACTTLWLGYYVCVGV